MTAPFKLEARQASRPADDAHRGDRRGQHAAPVARRLGGPEHRPRRASWRRSPGATLRGRARRRARRRRAPRAAWPWRSTPPAPRSRVHARRAEAAAAAGRRPPASTAGPGRPPAAGTSSSTPRRSAPRRDVGDDAARARRPRSTARSSTTSSTTRRRRRSSPGPARSAPTPSAASPMLVAQAEAQFAWWTGLTPPDGLMRRGRAARGSRPRLPRRSPPAHEAHHVRRIRRSRQARQLRAGVQGDRRRPADAGLGLPQGRRARRLRVPARERRRRRARRPLLVPRQGPVPGAAHDRRRRDRGAGRRDDRARHAVRRRAAGADGGVPVAVRARAAALHRRGGRLPRLRGGGLVRADHRPRRRRPAARRRRRVHALRHGAGLRPRAAPHPGHRQRPHQRRRGPQGALPVRLRQDRLRRERARAAAVGADAGARTARWC